MIEDRDCEVVKQQQQKSVYVIHQLTDKWRKFLIAERDTKKVLDKFQHKFWFKNSQQTRNRKELAQSDKMQLPESADSIIPIGERLNIFPLIIRRKRRYVFPCLFCITLY